MTATSLIMGAAIRNENVTPSGTPDSTNPKKRGMAEQEQKGVTMPRLAAITLPGKSFSAFERFAGTFGGEESPDYSNKEDD